MYIPHYFEENRIEILAEMITQYPLGCVILFQDGELNANHIPFELDLENNKLYAHIANNNPLAEQLAIPQDILIVFQVDQAYVSPNWYAGKFEHHRVVPTWNYVVIHIKGTAQTIKDEKVLRGILARLTRRHEAQQAQPWRMSDAPEDYIQEQLQHISAIEVDIAEMIGKFKLSQNRGESDIRAVAQQFADQGHQKLHQLMLENLKN